MDPSWHHNYASLGWIDVAARRSRRALSLDQAGAGRADRPRCTALAHDADKRAQYVADAAAYADQFKLSADQREALIKLDMPTIVKMGAHPLVPFLAQMQIQRLRPQR